MVAANSLDTHNDRVGPLPITVPQVHVDPVHRRGRRGALQPFGLPWKAAETADAGTAVVGERFAWLEDVILHPHVLSTVCNRLGLSELP